MIINCFRVGRVLLLRFLELLLAICYGRGKKIVGVLFGGEVC